MNRPLKILYTNFHPHYGGGHTTYLRYLLSMSQHQCYLACPKSSQLYHLTEQSGDAELLDLAFPSKLKYLASIVSSIKTLAHFIDQKQIDIVHCNENAEHRIVFYASLWCKTRFKVVLTKHNSKAIKRRFSSRWRFTHFNDAVIYVSPSIRHSIGIRQAHPNTHIIENGIDTQYWQLPMKAPGDIISLVSSAGTAPCKGWQYLVAALKSLPKEQRQRFRVTILGTKPAQDRLLSLCEGDPCPDIVQFLGYCDDPRASIQKSDIGFVLSDSEETISFACREMMSCGLPVIVSDVGSLPTNIDDEINGWICTRANIDSLVSVLKKILSLTPEQILTMKHAARQKALSSFELKTMLQKTWAVYHALLD